MRLALNIMRPLLPNTTWLKLINVVQRISRAGGERLRARGLGSAQFDLLTTIYKEPGRTQQDLAEMLGVTKGNASQLVSKLEVKGLVERVARGAAFSVELTREGKTFMDSVLPDYDAFMAEQFSRLSQDELKQLYKLLDKLTGEI